MQSTKGFLLFALLGVAACKPRIETGGLRDADSGACPPALASGGTLAAGQSLCSPNGRYKVTMQADGNFVLYDQQVTKGRKWQWATWTDAAKKVLVRGDCNLVVLGADDSVAWETATADKGSNCALEMQDDKNLVLYDAARKAVWWSLPQTNKDAIKARDQAFAEHLRSAQLGGDPTPEDARRIATNYFNNHISESLAATVATLRFLTPSYWGGFIATTGSDNLKPTLEHKADVFDAPTVKQVHALGSMAKAKMVIYSRSNPYQGIWGAARAEDDSNRRDQEIPLLVRFSEANPVGDADSLKAELDKIDADVVRRVFGPAASFGVEAVRTAAKSALSSFKAGAGASGIRAGLEFIPGMGLKFYHGNKGAPASTFSLIAMDSLAGQGDDQNFFKYPFSPDFSKNAPGSYNTESDPAKKQVIEARYNENPANKAVMSLVGDRFLAVMKKVLPNQYQEKLALKSVAGPHPFIIAIQDGARYSVDGIVTEWQTPLRPWRIVFVPGVNTFDDEARKAKITSPTPFDPSNPESDFRVKLASLLPGDIIYEVVAESRNGERYNIGRIELESTPVPSEWADYKFFIKHDFEIHRTSAAVPELAGASINNKAPPSEAQKDEQEKAAAAEFFREVLPQGQAVRVNLKYGPSCRYEGSKAVYAVSYVMFTRTSDEKVTLSYGTSNLVGASTSPSVEADLKFMIRNDFWRDAIAARNANQNGADFGIDSSFMMQFFRNLGGKWRITECRNVNTDDFRP